MACSADCSHDDLQFYPPKVWGLDYHFSVFNKMYVCDIQQMTEYPHFPGAFAYKNHPIYKVDVIGVIVKRSENSKCFIYAVDDGTGVILCCCWKDSFYAQTDKVNVDGLPDSLCSKVRELQDDSEAASLGYCLGDLVQMKGKVKIFRDKKEIVASYHKKVDDPGVQLFRICELPRLYAQRYDQPFQLPNKVQQALVVNLPAGDGERSEASISSDLKPVVFDIISKSDHIVDLPVSDLLNFAKVKEVLSHLDKSQATNEKELIMLHQTLSTMEEEGHVTKRNDRRMLFEVLLHKSKLEQLIMKILARDSQKPKYSEKGCHYMHVLDELHRTLQYAKVRKEAVLFCLQKLEMQSDVIRTTHAHYLPCNL